MSYWMYDSVAKFQHLDSSLCDSNLQKDYKKIIIKKPALNIY